MGGNVANLTGKPVDKGASVGTLLGMGLSLTAALACMGATTRKANQQTHQGQKRRRWR